MLKIEKRIETLRLKMYEAYAENPHGEEVLRISEELDKAINKYMKMQDDSS